MSLVSDQLVQIIELAKKGKETIERVEANWDKDREDFSEFKTRLAHLEIEVKTLREVVSKMPGLTQDQVADAVAPVLEEAQQLSETINNKQVIALDKAEIKKKRSLFRFF